MFTFFDNYFISTSMKKLSVQLSFSLFCDEESLTEAQAASAPPTTAQYANVHCAVVAHTNICNTPHFLFYYLHEFLEIRKLF
jgi:hypothetical protein